MTSAEADPTVWSIAGAVVTPALPGADAFCTTSVFEHLRAGAARDPDAIAIAGLSTRLSYAELFGLVCNAAAAISERVAPGEAVACITSRGPHDMAALLGCLVASRPCMVIDAANPVERQATLIEDAAPAMLLASAPVTFPYHGPVLTLAGAIAGSGRDWRPDIEWDPDAPAAIHFTSGSTGRPKGIVLSARSLLYRGFFGVETLGITAESRVFLPNCPTANGGFATMLASLSLGARTVLADLKAEGAGNALKLLEREGVTVGAIIPQVLSMLLHLPRAKQTFQGFRSMRIGGAGVLWSDLTEWRASLPPDCAIMHSYASSEALNMAQWLVPQVNTGDEATVPAGYLHLCHEYALLDDSGNPSAPGEPGELVLRGPYVSLGEWRGGALDARRVRPVPGHPGWRTFRTGDVLRVHPDGTIRILGRVDRQVKINGVLVQPAEIEALLKGQPGVTDAAVVARASPTGASLHGFVVAPEADAVEIVATLRRRLTASLPAVFRPASLRVLPRLPIMPSGKVDLVALARLSEPSTPR